MKKFAALVLALMMVLSLVPMASADEPIVIRYGTHWTAGWNPNEIDPATGTYTMTDEADRQLRLKAEEAVLLKHNVKIEHVQYAQDVRSELVLSVLAGNPCCEIARMWNGSESTVLAQNVLQPLDDYAYIFEGADWMWPTAVYGHNYFLNSNVAFTQYFPLVVNLTMLEAVPALKEADGSTLYPMELLERGQWTWTNFKDYLGKVHAFYSNTPAPEGCVNANIVAYEVDYRINPKANEPERLPEYQSYDQFFAGSSPSPSLRDALISLTSLLGYTREMLIEDCAAFGVTPSFHEPAQFNLAVEFSLEGGDLIARIPADEIKTGNDFYKMQRIALLPNFLALPAAAENTGYFLTPDGSGALMRFNTFVGSMAKYDRPYMDNDYYADYYYQSEYAEELRMPLFGVINGEAPSTHGMLAIIEDGVDTANLHITLGSTTGSGKKATYTGINAAYVSVDTLEHAKVRINGAYETDSPTYVSDSGHINVDFTVRYKPYTSEVTYFDLAMDYRDYLSAQSGVEITAPEGPTTFVEVLGAVTLIDRIAGVPYDNITSMSTYKEVAEIVKALPEGSVVQYDGAFNGGVISELNDGARLVKENGTTAELQELLAAAKQKNTKLYWQANISRVYVNGRSYIPFLHALRDFSNQAAEVYLYTPDTAMFNGRYDPIRAYTRVSPKYLPYLADQFLADLKAQNLDLNLAIGDLGHDVFADYRYNNVINAVQANTIVEDTLKKLNAASALTLNDPSSELAPMADYITNVSHVSSDYASFYATVPFRQLALRGLTGIIGQDVNLNSRGLDYYLLQAAELGMGVKYTVTAKNPAILKSSHFESLYAADWNQWKDEILQAAEKVAELRAVIGGKQIVNHELLAENVFQTTYEGGVTVITNYTALPFESASGVVEAGTYLLAQEGGAL